MRCDIYDSFGHLSKPNNINRCCPKAPGKPATNINKQENYHWRETIQMQTSEVRYAQKHCSQPNHEINTHANQ